MDKKNHIEVIELDAIIPLTAEESNFNIEFENKKMPKEKHPFVQWFDYINTSDEQETIIAHNDIHPPTRERDIIFDFDPIQNKSTADTNGFQIGEDPELLKILDTYVKDQKAMKKTIENSPIDVKSMTENSLKSPSIITESMAILYTHQNNYSKAIEIYTKLIEQFPEKITYFASQINKLKKN